MGAVRGLRSNCALLDLGGNGVVGVLHKTQISHQKLDGSVSEVFRLGDRLKV